MNKLHKIRIPIYNENLYFQFGRADKLKDNLVKIGIPSHKILDIRANILGRFTFYEDECKFVIWVRDPTISALSLSILVHEIEHFVYFFLDYKGFKHTDESDEAYAYLASYVFEETSNLITKYNDLQK